MRRGLIVLLVAGTALLALAAPAAANIRTGNQNPDLVVTAQIGPNHASVGDTLVWSASVTNTTGRTLSITLELAVSTPDSTFGMGEATTLKPHQGIAIQRSLTAHQAGTYTIRVRAADGNGRSHAAAWATVA